MQKQEKQNHTSQKGITLIALVITIIVMLILVTLSIRIVTTGGLFNYGGNAVRETQNAINVEQELQNGRIQIGGVWYDSIDDYFNNSPSERIHDWQYTDITLAELHCNCEECKKVNSEGLTYSIGQQVDSGRGLLSNTSQVTGAEWVVFGREDSDGDDKYETLLLTTSFPSPTVNFALSNFESRTEAADVYNNGVEQLDALIKEMYGDGARAMTIEDVNATLG